MPIEDIVERWLRARGRMIEGEVAIIVGKDEASLIVARHTTVESVAAKIGINPYLKEE